ncbi:serine/threonine-protein phosphatase [Candidatus Wolfebacteria bacterium]|nr:serine/threonine-protein phosphatase [Candidatus Wolfebacteria bacterium]
MVEPLKTQEEIKEELRRLAAVADSELGLASVATPVEESASAKPDEPAAAQETTGATPEPDQEAIKREALDAAARIIDTIVGEQEGSQQRPLAPAPPESEQRRAEQDAEIERKKFDVGAGSIASEKHPDRNEDVVFVDEKNGLFAVFDGMGGHAAGEVAAGEAVKYLKSGRFPNSISLEQTQSELEGTLREANAGLLSRVRKEPALHGMGTTASVVKVWEGAGGEQKIVVGNIGDSRIYILHRGGTALEQITLDDNSVDPPSSEKEARLLQKTLNGVTDLKSLNPRELAAFRRRNQLSQCLGIATIEPHIYVRDIVDGEQVIITSDGIHDNLTDLEIVDIVSASETAERAVEALLAAASARSREKHLRAKPDDMSAIVVKILAAREDPLASPAPEEENMTAEATLSSEDEAIVQEIAGEPPEGLTAEEWLKDVLIPEAIKMRKVLEGPTFEDFDAEWKNLTFKQKMRTALRKARSDIERGV